MSKIVVMSNTSDFQRGRSVIIGVEQQHGLGEFAYIKGPLMFTPLDPQELLIDPTFGPRHGHEFLQAALEHAWEIGLRPKNWRLETTEQVAAITNHLDDMRALVFGAKIEIPDFRMTGRAPASKT